MEHLPPWLRNLPLPPRPPGRGEAPAPAAAPADDEMPSWLVELQGEVGDDAAAGATADWLADLPAADPGAGSPADRPEPFADPAWLREPPPEAAADQGEQQSTTSRVKMPVGATDWLRSIGQDPDARSEPLSEPIGTPEDQSGVPDWLRDLSADEVARGIASDVPDSQPRFDPQAPGWLADDLPTPDASTVSANFRDEPRAGDEIADDVPDWLRGAAEADAAEPPRGDQRSADLAGSAEVPAWLRDLGEQTPAQEEPATDDEPAWLRDAAARPPTDRLGPGDELDVPAWLRGADDAPPPAPPAWPQEGAAQEPTGDDEMPSWLRESAPSADLPAGAVASPQTPRDDAPPWLAEPPAPAGADEVPAWLRDAEPPAPSPDAPSGPDDMPSWLRAIEQPEPPPPSPEAPGWRQSEAPTAPPAAEDVPSWLQGEAAPPPPPAAEDVPSWLQGEAAPPPPPAAEDVPPWLQGEAAPPPPPQTRDLPPWLAAEDAAPGAPPPADPGLPSWLRGVADEPPLPPPGQRPAPPPPRRAVPSAEQGESHSFLSGAELPSWLRVPEPERPADPREGQALDWLRRLGGPEQDDELPAAAVAAVQTPQRPQYRRSAEQLAAVELLQQISRAPYPAPVTPAAPARLTRWQRIGLDRLLYALLALALLVGLLVPAVTGPLQTAAPAAPGAAELGALLDGLGGDDVALVAYEWGAQRSSELRPLEQAVTSRLINNRVKLILVSTDLQGTLLSFDLIGPLRAAGYNTENGVSFGGRDYVLLGYRPGGELALRSLAQDLRGELRSDFDGQDATQGLVANNADGSPRFDGINDLSLILVLADQPQDVQAWMEQVRPSAREVPMAFVLPQEAQPQSQPFLRLPNVYHVAGQQGALALSSSNQAGDPAAVAQATGRLWYAVAIFLALLAVGAVAAAVGRGRAARGGAA